VAWPPNSAHRNLSNNLAASLSKTKFCCPLRLLVSLGVLELHLPAGQTVDRDSPVFIRRRSDRPYIFEVSFLCSDLFETHQVTTMAFLAKLARLKDQTIWAGTVPEKPLVRAIFPKSTPRGLGPLRAIPQPSRLERPNVLVRLSLRRERPQFGEYF
jgi:hypothetical protein